MSPFCVSKYRAFSIRLPATAVSSNDASRLIAGKYGVQHHLARADRSCLKSIVNAGLQQASGAPPDPLKLTGKLL